MTLETRTNPRTLRGLLEELPGARLLRGDPGTEISAVHHDSRLVGPGSLFAAIPGFTVDGHRFLAEVAAAGAAAALVEADRELPPLPESLALVEVPAARPALAAASAWFYGHPGRELAVIGITGTDGKTTTSHLLTYALEAAGARVGRLGTVDTYLPGESGHVTARMTTPEAPEVQRLLRRMADAHCDYAIVESTSHGLALHRLDHVEYDIAVFTNITSDHLDFHQTFEAYRDAKARLFAALEQSAEKGIGKHAVVNADDPSAQYMLNHAPGAAPTRFGLEARDADVVARNIILRPDGSTFRIVAPQGMAECTIRLPAMFNVMNALAAASAALAVGADLQAVARGLGECPGVPGRMERIQAGQPFEVIVDYAHTGDAVRKVLEVLRDVCQGRLIIVVGAAGERDPGRRFGVGRAAAEGADFAIFTNEDPRSEDPSEIVREIGRHAESAGRQRGTDFLEIEDRREAIATALGMARFGDIVVIAGKGHEKSIVYGSQAMPWDDREVAREELARLGYRS
ncbi:MAG: UDP-N-acetylmuramoyl-L-alanyl-D-glutamate--2,6-diaminopimelate ligase [Tepidiforma sp.]|nr:MAG: UDP-N-acetylmuramoyl-L-alanyl-D-glutamate--2,6-diaminopimelate ligase [Tepidiforma sp.]